MSTFVLPEGELRWRLSRSSGPGGQGVNTTDSRVELSLDLAALDGLVSEPARQRALRRLHPRLIDGVLTVVAAEHRSQLRNRDVARERMTALIVEALRPDPPERRPTKPSRRARQRRMDEKTHRGRTKRLRGRTAD